MMKCVVLLFAFAVSAWALPVQQSLHSPEKIKDLKDKLEFLQQELRQLRSDLQIEERGQDQDTQARVQAILEKFPEKDREALRTVVQQKLKYLNAILGNTASNKGRKIVISRELINEDEEPEETSKRKLIISRDLEEEPPVEPQESDEEELKAIAQRMTTRDFQLLRKLRSKLLMEMNNEKIAAKREETEEAQLPEDPYAELKSLVGQMGPNRIELLKDLIKKARYVAPDLDEESKSEEETQEDKRGDLSSIKRDLGPYAEKLGKDALEYLQSHPSKLQEVENIIEEVKKGEWNNPSEESDVAPVEKTEDASPSVQEKPEEIERALNGFDDRYIDGAQANPNLRQEIPEGTFGEIIEDGVKRNLEPQQMNHGPGAWKEAPLPVEELGKEPETETEKMGERLLNDIDAAHREGVNVKELLSILEEREEVLKNKEEEELEALIAP